VHFPRSKAGLLTAAVQSPFDPGEVLLYVLAKGGHIGERIARTFIDRWEGSGQNDVILTLLQAAISAPRAATLMRPGLAVFVWRRAAHAARMPSARSGVPGACRHGPGTARSAGDTRSPPP
jgi:hypothetical protein